MAYGESTSTYKVTEKKHDTVLENLDIGNKMYTSEISKPKISEKSSNSDHFIDSGRLWDTLYCVFATNTPFCYIGYR